MAVKSESVEAKIETIKRVVARKAKTYEERKAQSLSEGRKYLYLKCPLCNLCRPFKTHLKGSSKFKVYPDPDVVQARYGIGGRGTGFFKKDEECIRLDKLKESYPEVYENLKAEIGKLYEMLQVRG